MLHTRKCGEISEEDFGSEQTLCGWLQDTRNLGGIAFLQLRDITGVIQLTLLKKKLGDNFKPWASINRESIIQVTGTVKENKEAPVGRGWRPRLWFFYFSLCFCICHLN